MADDDERKREIKALNAEYERTGRTWTAAMYNEKHGEIDERARLRRKSAHAAALPAPERNFVTMGAVKSMARLVAQSLVEQTRPLHKRIAELETKVSESRGGGVTIRAGSVSVDGMEQVAGMMSRLDATLRSPVKPVYDKNGILIGARREALPGDEAGEGGSTGAALEARIEALEKKPHMKYRGVWSADGRYHEGDVATDGGSMFHCNRSSTARPGTSSDWTLAVKRGRDLR